MKGRGQERPLDFSLKSYMAKTAPNFACQFVYMCRKLSALHLFPSVSVAYFRNKVCKNTCMSWSASFGAALLHNERKRPFVFQYSDY